MKKLFFVLTFLVWSFREITFAAAADVCLEYKIDPEIEFLTSYGELVYDRSYNRRQLTELGEKFGIVEHGLFASGLATIGVTSHVSVSAASRRNDNGSFCVIPTKVSIFVGYQNPTIYLSGDLRPGSCEYNLVLRHEQTHQQINVTALEYFLPKLKQASEALISNISPRQVNRQEDIEPAIKELSEIYLARIEPLVNFLKSELGKEQGKLDSHENYDFEGNLCRYYNATH